MIHYQKRKNTPLFKNIEKVKQVTHLQNYIPIYNKLFQLNETNFNNINLNHPWHVHHIKKQESNDDPLDALLRNIEDDKQIERTIFLKMAPLLDPFKYICGKFSPEEHRLLSVLPSFDSTINYLPQFKDENNCAYVDGFFVYLTDVLQSNFYFTHGLSFYGSFLGIKKGFEFNIADDLDYLTESDYFMKNKNVLFQVESYDHIYDTNLPHEENKRVKLNIEETQISEGEICFDTIPEKEFSELFIDLNEVSIDSQEMIEFDNDNNNNNQNNTSCLTLKSFRSDTCSSRTSHTSDFSEEEKEEEHEDEYKTEEDDSSCWESEEEDFDDDIVIKASLPEFPVNLIFMEHCEETLDSLMSGDTPLTTEEWQSLLFQVIMILLTYQKTFSFTHNDLHTNNIMYNTTEKSDLYYCFEGQYYKVPTFGRIFKIIDFGRAIYKVNEKVYCSSSYQLGDDASGQYNIEPYFNPKKPRLEPNYSFDLCRLACSIFDYLVEDLDKLDELINVKKDPIVRIINEWCLDDKGVHMLYKKNGLDRYPEFKLYKMIARCVHNHTPQAQLNRPEFMAYEYKSQNIPGEIIDIDKIPVYA